MLKQEEVVIVIKVIFLLMFFVGAAILTYKFIKSKHFDPFLKKLSTMLDEGQTKIWSSQRFRFFVTMLMSNIVVWTLYFGLSLFAEKLVEIPSSLIELYLGANALEGLLKWGQKKEETKQMEAGKTTN